MTRQIDKAYSHKKVEGPWYARWFDAGYFRPSRPSAHPFSMVIPPPNVTGSLHMGHALNNTLQDILCRYKRMDGHNVLSLIRKEADRERDIPVGLEQSPFPHASQNGRGWRCCLSREERAETKRA